MKRIKTWLRSQEAATAIEYSLLAGGIAVACIAAIFLLGDDLEVLFNTVGDAIANAANNV